MTPRRAAVRRQRFVYVGASNFARALPHLWTSLRARAGKNSVGTREGVDLLAACGLGRAYGSSSVFGIAPLHRTLTPLRSCRLWTEVGRNSDPVRAAWIGDLGNDIAYGADASQLLGWLDECLGVFPDGTPIAVVEPTVEPISRLGEAQFALLGKMLFPGRALSRERVVGELTATRQALRQRWGEPGFKGEDESSPSVTLIRTPVHWIGWDRIHVRADRRVEWADRLIDAVNPVATSSVGDGRQGSPTSLGSGPLQLARDSDSRDVPPGGGDTRAWWRLQSESSVLSVLGTRWRLGREQPALAVPEDGSRLVMF